MQDKGCARRGHPRELLLELSLPRSHQLAQEGGRVRGFLECLRSEDTLRDPQRCPSGRVLDIERVVVLPHAALADLDSDFVRAEAGAGSEWHRALIAV